MGIALDLQAVVNELFAQFSSTVTRVPKASETVDAWGEPVIVDGASTPLTAIIDLYNQYSAYFTNGRPIQGADVVFIFKGTDTIEQTDTFQFDGVDYRPITINPIMVEDTKVVYLVSASIK